MFSLLREKGTVDISATPPAQNCNAQENASMEKLPSTSRCQVGQVQIGRKRKQNKNNNEYREKIRAHFITVTFMQTFLKAVIINQQ